MTAVPSAVHNHTRTSVCSHCVEGRIEGSVAVALGGFRLGFLFGGYSGVGRNAGNQYLHDVL